ncbi:MAG: extracellular solute-binding protein [bacterium]|nr:extracellular solute-binding protein [bacterium]
MLPISRLASRLLAVLALAALLPSCGQVPGAGTDALAAVDPVHQDVLIWYTHEGAREQTLLDMYDLFNTSNPHGITVRGEHIGEHDELYRQMLLGIEGGPLPQIVEAYQNQTQTYHREGLIADLEPYMTSTLWGLTTKDRADFIPEFLQQDNINGVQTALLPNRSMEVLYYNQQWLEELGFEDPPADWDTFIEMCAAAHNRGFSGSQGTRNLGILWERDASRLASIIYSLGGHLMDAGHTRYTYDTPETRQALGMMRDLVQSGAAALTEDNGDLDAFVAGEVLFAQRSSASAPQFDEAIGDRFAWGVAGLPTNQLEPVENVYGASLAIIKNTPEQQLASWLFIKWFTETEQQDRWSTATGYFPVRRSIAHRLGPYFRVAYNLLQYGRPEPSVGGYEPVRALVVDVMIAVIGGADMQKALADLESAANATLQESR